MRIYPKSETVFQWRVVKAQVEFVAGEEGKVEKVIYTQGGSSFDAAKVDLPDAIEISTEKLDEYVGSYSFGLLAGNMVISRDGEQMYGKLAGQPKLKIIPVAEDEFTWVDVAATMKFVRDEVIPLLALRLHSLRLRSIAGLREVTAKDVAYVDPKTYADLLASMTPPSPFFSSHCQTVISGRWTDVSCRSNCRLQNPIRLSLDRMATMIQ